MGRKICVCLSRCNPWRKIYSGVGNSSAQTVGDHAPREWEDPQAKRSGGMERSGSLCGRVDAPRETLHGRQCGSIGELCELANPAQVHCGGSAGQGAKEVLLAEGAVAKRMAAPWQEWQHREAPAGWKSAQKKPAGVSGAKP